MTTFGIEEEFFLVDPATLRPVSLAGSVLRELPGEAGSPGRVTDEFLASELERATPVCTDLAEAERDLAGWRTAMATAAREHGSLVVGTGTPFDTSVRPAITPSPRYREVSSRARGLLHDHQICAVHVHVGVPDREAGVRALNSVRVWLPTLLALTGNSPFWRGRDTGFASWRAVIMRRWDTTGCPPVFIDEADYNRRLARLIGVGTSVDSHTVAWYARLSERYPTLEVRVADAQLHLPRTLLFAALARALVVTGLAEAERGTAAPGVEPELLDAALWHASRDGVSGRLLDPIGRELAPARGVVDALFRHVGDALDDVGDRPPVAALLDQLWQAGTGAETQRHSFRTGGIPGLRGVYESSSG